MPIRLFTFGGLGSEADGQELDWLGSQWLRAAILVHLTLERSATRDALQAMFWPDGDANSAAHRLSQAVYAVRRAVGEDIIETRGRELRASDSLEADALDFEAALEKKRYEEAIALYRGPFLNGVHLAPTNAFESWVDARRAKYAREFRKACRVVVDAKLAAGNVAGAIAAAQQWVAPDPLDDEAQHRLIELLAASGGRNEALKQYESYARLLAADGLQPLDQTRELAAAIERQTNGATFPARESVASTSGSVEEPDRPTISLPASGLRRRSRIAIRVAAVAVVAVIVWLLTALLRLPKPQSAESALMAPVPIAVLVFDDETGGRLGWLANDITRSLIDAFRTVPELRMRPMHAVWPYRDGRMTHVEIARTLGVKRLITGSVHQTGDRIYARVELVDGSTADIIDASEVHHATDDQITLIDKVAADVSQKMEVVLRQIFGREMRLARWRLETRNRRAFHLAQRADDIVLAESEVVTSGDLKRGWDMLRSADSLLADAAREDPKWPEPWIQRARVARKIALTILYPGVSPDSVTATLRRGIQSADAALDRQPNSPRALEAKGMLLQVWATRSGVDTAESTRLMKEAESLLVAATAGNRSLAPALSNLSSIHYGRADFRKAADLAEKAYAADAYLEEAREILNRLFTIRFEAAQDSEAERWCGVLGDRFANSWDHARCELLLMAWNNGRTPDTRAAWALADSAILRSPEAFRSQNEAQLQILVAGVIARAGAADSAERVLTRAYARAAAAGVSLSGSTAWVLLRDEAGARVLLNQFGAARRLLDECLRRAPRSRALLEQSRRFSTLRSRQEPQPITSR